MNEKDPLALEKEQLTKIVSRMDEEAARTLYIDDEYGDENEKEYENLDDKEYKEEEYESAFNKGAISLVGETFGKKFELKHKKDVEILVNFVRELLKDRFKETSDIEAEKEVWRKDYKKGEQILIKGDQLTVVAADHLSVDNTFNLTIEHIEYGDDRGFRSAIIGKSAKGKIHLLHNSQAYEAAVEEGKRLIKEEKKKMRKEVGEEEELKGKEVIKFYKELPTEWQVKFIFIIDKNTCSLISRKKLAEEEINEFKMVAVEIAQRMKVGIDYSYEDKEGVQKKLRVKVNTATGVLLKHT